MRFIKNAMLLSMLVFSISAFADDSFTVDIGSEYDATNSAVFSVKISSEFGDNKTNAFALEGAAGEKTMRTNATYGFLLGDSNMFKVTGDFLYQKLEFDFGLDFGKHEENVYQNAFGAGYRYDLGGSIFKGLEVSSYISYAPSKTSNYKPLPFIYSPTEEEGLYDMIEFHGRLAGSTASHTSVGVDVSPLKDSLLTIGVDYDTITFDNKWSKKVNQNNFGGHVELNQVVLPRLKATSHYRFSQMAESYGGGFSALISSPNLVQFELLGDISYEDNTVLKRKNTLGKLTLRTNLWVEKPTESYVGSYDKKTLLTWVQQPVVRMHDVMVLPEMKYTKDAKVYTYLNAPDKQLLKSKGSVKDSYYNQGARWNTISTSSGFDANTAVFKYISYNQSEGTVTANYMDDNSKQLILDYAGYRKVEGYLGKNWRSTGTDGTTYQCQEKSASSCKFKVTL